MGELEKGFISARLGGFLLLVTEKRYCFHHRLAGKIKPHAPLLSMALKNPRAAIEMFCIERVCHLNAGGFFNAY